MSQFYGLLAGLFVGVSTWGAMTYVSPDIGGLVGLFLVTFFIVTTVYINGDEMHERQKSVIKSLTDMEIIFFEKLNHIERKIDFLETKEPADRAPVRPPASSDPRPELDHAIHMVEQILGVAPETEHHRSARIPAATSGTHDRFA